MSIENIAGEIGGKILAQVIAVCLVLMTIGGVVGYFIGKAQAEKVVVEAYHPADIVHISGKRVYTERGIDWTSETRAEAIEFFSAYTARLTRASNMFIDEDEWEQVKDTLLTQERDWPKDSLIKQLPNNDHRR